MAETLHEGIWGWASMMADLCDQGGLPGVEIDPLSVTPDSCLGTMPSGGNISISWQVNCLLMVTTEKEEPALINAFAIVVEYRPCCRYLEDDGRVTYDWAKFDARERFAELQGQGARDLQQVQ